mgnify:FL=1
MLSLSSWAFMAVGTDVSAGIQYGFRYRLENSYSVISGYTTRSSNNDAFYALTSAATFMWTKDLHTPHCNCNMQYVRVYTNFVPYNQDMMISLALMNPTSINFKLFQLMNFQRNNRQNVYISFCCKFSCRRWANNTCRCL